MTEVMADRRFTQPLSAPLVEGERRAVGEGRVARSRRVRSAARPSAAGCGPPTGRRRRQYKATKRGRRLPVPLPCRAGRTPRPARFEVGLGLPQGDTERREAPCRFDVESSGTAAGGSRRLRREAWARVARPPRRRPVPVGGRSRAPGRDPERTAGGAASPDRGGAPRSDGVGVLTIQCSPRPPGGGWGQAVGCRQQLSVGTGEGQHHVERGLGRRDVQVFAAPEVELQRRSTENGLGGWSRGLGGGGGPTLPRPLAAGRGQDQCESRVPQPPQEVEEARVRVRRFLPPCPRRAARVLRAARSLPAAALPELPLLPQLQAVEARRESRGGRE
jgi:hypothetical protein